MKNMNTVSLCMIVYNEESSLLTCLESAKHLVDEIIIIDTGSTDQTLSLAQQAGARILSYQWESDFALARNFSLFHASGDWILVLDADEILEPCTRQQFQELFVHADIEGYFLPIHNVLQGKNQETLDHIVRLFRNRPHYRFEGALHEQIVPSILRSCGEKSLAHAPISIIHYGYLSYKIKEKSKSDRNQQILTKELTKDPNNPFYLYCLGLEYLQRNELESGIPFLEAALNRISTKEGYYPDLLLNLALSYLKTEKLPPLFSALDQGLKTIEKPRDYLLLYGIGHLLASEPSQAIERLNQALNIQDTPSEIFTCSQIYSLLGDSYSQANLSQAAIYAYLEALKASPRYLYPFIQILALLRRTYTPEQFIVNEALLYQISSFALPDLLQDMAARLVEQENVPLALLLMLCALFQAISVVIKSSTSSLPLVPSARLLDIPVCYHEILAGLDKLDANKVAPVLSKSLELMGYELDLHCQFIRRFPEELIFLNRLPCLILELFTMITFHYLPSAYPPSPSPDLILNILNYSKQEGG